MTKQAILFNVLGALKTTGATKNTRTFAETLDYNYTCLSSALNGEERYLTDRLFRRVLKAYPQVNPDYIKRGEGSILIETPDGGAQEHTVVTPAAAPVNGTVEKLIGELAAQREMTARAQEQTEKALAQIDQLIEIVRKVALKEGEE